MRVTISRHGSWHGDITLITAQQYIKCPMWQIKKALTMNHEINGWSIKKVSDEDAD